jgi:threonine 3-dehydrogenase
MKVLVKDRPVEGKKWARGFRLMEKPVPTVESPNDVIIKVVAAAVCGTDVGIYHSKDSLHISMRKALTDPITVGHEFCGHIVDLGARARSILAKLLVKKAKNNPDIMKMLGEDNAASLAANPRFGALLKKFNASAEMHVVCHECYQCKRHEYHVCRNTIIKGMHDDGAFAEYVKVPAENVVLYLQKEIPLEIIAFMDAIGNATHTVFSADIRKGSALVLGCGVQGLMATAVAKYAGAEHIFVTDASHGDLTHDKLEATRFALARRYGADDCFDVAIPAERERMHQVIMAATNNTGVDAAYEMSGNYNAYVDTFRNIRMGGTFSLLGIPPGTMNTDFATDVIFSGVTVKGIIGRRVFETWDQMEKLLKAGLAKQFLKSGFITHEFPLEDFDKAFDVIAKGDAYKVLLRP